MHYNSNPSMVRVDFFKPSGKWYATEQMEWLSYTGNIHKVFRDSLANIAAYGDMDAVCLDPYHEHSHPVMRKAGT